MDRPTAQRWLDDYVSAWKSYDPDAIGASFAEGVSYRFHPYDEPLVGREAVVAGWLGTSDARGAPTRDAPGTYDAHYTPYAVEGDAVVGTGTSVYRGRRDGPVEQTFDNCFLIRFDRDDRCAEFTELYMKRPR